MRPVCLIPGWGFKSDVMEPLKCHLGSETQIIPLPYGNPESDWLETLLERVTPESILIGWSLGGQLAARLATYPDVHCPALITVASNPCFVEREDWPWAMSQSVFHEFKTNYENDPAATLKKFQTLNSLGAQNPKTLMKNLAGVLDDPKPELLTGLILLSDLDGRADLHAFDGPALCLFADHDALVPLSVSSHLHDLKANLTVDVIEGAAHALVMQKPAELADRIRHFLQDNNLL